MCARPCKARIQLEVHTEDLRHSRRGAGVGQQQQLRVGGLLFLLRVGGWVPLLRRVGGCVPIHKSPSCFYLKTLYMYMYNTNVSLNDSDFIGTVKYSHSRHIFCYDVIDVFFFFGVLFSSLKF